MKTIHRFAILLAALVSFSFSDRAWSDTFGSGLNTFDIEFVTIGNPGNLPDTTGNPTPPHPTGTVLETFRIGKFEISEQMIDKANAQSLADGVPLGITKNIRGPDKPATSVSWFEATKFVNWLNTSTGGTPAYKFDGSGNFQLWDVGDAGFNPANRYRNSRARYFLPSVDEWYKAAYYDPSANGGAGGYWNFPTGSDSAPTPVASGTAAGTAVYNGQSGPADVTLAGGLSPYGTMGQGGNVWEWEETDSDLVNDSTSSRRVIRGGSWLSNSGHLLSLSRNETSPSNVFIDLGFRVASIPEPSTTCLGALGMVAVLWWRRRRS